MRAQYISDHRIRAFTYTIPEVECTDFPRVACPGRHMRRRLPPRGVPLPGTGEGPLFFTQLHTRKKCEQQCVETHIWKYAETKGLIFLKKIASRILGTCCRRLGCPYKFATFTNDNHLFGKGITFFSFSHRSPGVGLLAMASAKAGQNSYSLVHDTQVVSVLCAFALTSEAVAGNPRLDFRIQSFTSVWCVGVCLHNAFKFKEFLNTHFSI